MIHLKNCMEQKSFKVCTLQMGIFVKIVRMTISGYSVWSVNPMEFKWVDANQTIY